METFLPQVFRKPELFVDKLNFPDSQGKSSVTYRSALSHWARRWLGFELQLEGMLSLVLLLRAAVPPVCHFSLQVSPLLGRPSVY